MANSKAFGECILNEHLQWSKKSVIMVRTLELRHGFVLLCKEIIILKIKKLKLFKTE